MLSVEKEDRTVDYMLTALANEFRRRIPGQNLQPAAEPKTVSTLPAESSSSSGSGSSSSSSSSSSSDSSSSSTESSSSSSSTEPVESSSSNSSSSSTEPSSSSSSSLAAPSPLMEPSVQSSEPIEPIRLGSDQEIKDYFAGQEGELLKKAGFSERIFLCDATKCKSHFYSKIRTVLAEMADGSSDNTAIHPDDFIRVIVYLWNFATFHSTVVPGSVLDKAAICHEQRESNPGYVSQPLYDYFYSTKEGNNTLFLLCLSTGDHPDKDVFRDKCVGYTLAGNYGSHRSSSKYFHNYIFKVRSCLYLSLEKAKEDYLKNHQGIPEVTVLSPNSIRPVGAELVSPKSLSEIEEFCLQDGLADLQRTVNDVRILYNRSPARGKITVWNDFAKLMGDYLMEATLLDPAQSVQVLAFLWMKYRGLDYFEMLKEPELFREVHMMKCPVSASMGLKTIEKNITEAIEYDPAVGNNAFNITSLALRLCSPPMAANHLLGLEEADLVELMRFHPKESNTIIQHIKQRLNHQNTEIPGFNLSTIYQRCEEVTTLRNHLVQPEHFKKLLNSIVLDEDVMSCLKSFATFYQKSISLNWMMFSDVLVRMVEQENITVKMIEIAGDILRRISCQKSPSGIFLPYHYRYFVDPMKVAMALVKRVKKNPLILEEPSGAHSKLLEFIRTIVVVECPDSYQAAMVTKCDSIISYEKRLSKPYVYLLENGIHIY